MASNIFYEEVLKRTPNSKTFRLFDGSLQTNIFLGDIHYEDENGHFQNIDTSMNDEADFDSWDFPVAREGKDIFYSKRDKAFNDKKANKLNRDNYDFQGLKVPYHVRVPRNWKRGYEVGKGENKLVFKPIGASVSKGYIDDDNASKIIFQDAWNDVDASLELQTNGVKETLILKTSKAPTTFSFEVSGGLSDELVCGELKVNAAWLVDAVGTKRDVGQTVRVDGEKVYFDLEADVTDLVYPIEIDPTVSIAKSTSGWIDSYVDRSNPSVNYGSAQYLINGGKYSYYQQFMSFTKIPLDSIPSGSYIESAILHEAEVSGVSGVGYNREGRICLGEWTETGITYNNMPSVDATVYTLSHVGGGYFPYTDVPSNITTMVRRWVHDGLANYGFMCGMSDYAWNTDGYYCSFSSKENAAYTAPYLSVIYNVPPSSPTLTYPNGGETLNAEHTITWNAATDASASDVNDISYTLINGSTMVTAGQPMVAQTFTTVSQRYIKKFQLHIAGGTNGLVDIKITGVNGGYPDLNTVYASVTNFAVLGATLDWYTVTLPVPFSVPLGTALAIVLIYNSGSGYTISVAGGNSDDYSGGKACFYGTYWRDLSIAGIYDLDFYVITNEQTPQNKLKYQIQLATDGSNYNTTILALSNEGVTSYAYDFSSIAQTSTAKIRVRAYDGTSYGSWDESDGVFSIIHNLAPTAPTNLSPASGAHDRVQIIRLAWQHNDPNSDPQSKFDLQYSVDAGTNWATVTETTSNQYYDAPASTFAKGNVIWKVRTYDQADLSSAYSEQATFYAGDKPATPEITAPLTSTAVARPNATWSSSGQMDYQVRVKDGDTTVVYDTGTVTSTNKAQTIGYDLANGASYTIELRIRNSDGLWSDYDTEAIAVSYTPPATPTITATAGIIGEGFITVNIVNPIPEGTEPDVETNDIYRREPGDMWQRIATGITANGHYVDYAIASETTYEYKVRAQADNATYADSAASSTAIALRGVWLHDVAEPARTVYNFRYDPDRSDKWQAQVSLQQYAGRTRPVAEFGEQNDNRITVKLQLIKQTGDLAALEALIQSMATVCYRDGRGRRIFGIIPELPKTDEKHGNTATIEIVETAYSEVV